MSSKIAKLKIALAGVPGSGKTALAKSLQKEFEKDPEKYGSIAIIDDYISEIEEETDLALGFFGTYIGNIHVALGREYRDRIAREEHDTTITCGTLFETSAYLAQKMEREFSILEEEGEKYEWNLRVDASMRYISCLYLDTVRYDMIYHLSPIVLEEENIDITTLERSLQAAFNAFELFPVTRLEANGTSIEEITQDRLQVILKEIENANQAKKQSVQS